MSAAVAPLVSRPVKVALVILVCWLRTKSSADSIPNVLAVVGRDAVPILPSGPPVLKKKGVAVAADAASSRDTAKTEARHVLLFMVLSFISGRSGKKMRRSEPMERNARNIPCPIKQEFACGVGGKCKKLRQGILPTAPP